MSAIPQTFASFHGNSRLNQCRKAFNTSCNNRNLILYPIGRDVNGNKGSLRQALQREEVQIAEKTADEIQGQGAGDRDLTNFVTEDEKIVTSAGNIVGVGVFVGLAAVALLKTDSNPWDAYQLAVKMNPIETKVRYS